jgi:hypothetical protein
MDVQRSATVRLHGTLRFSQFHPSGPSTTENAISRQPVVNLDFRDVQPVCDLTITETLTSQAIDRAQDSYFFPKHAHKDLLDIQ